MPDRRHSVFFDFPSELRYHFNFANSINFVAHV